MNSIQRKSLLLAFCITMIVVGLLFFYMQKSSLNVGPEVKVVVASENIPAKTVISDKQVTEISVPKKFVTAVVVSSKKQVVGKVAKETIYKGEQILEERLVHGKEDGGLAAVIPAGFRAVTVKVDSVSGAGGHILNGDFVDVLLYLESPDNLNKVKTIFQKVKVLDVASDEIAKDTKKETVITLCMTPQDIEKLFLANELGKVRLILRPTLDKEQQYIPGTSTEDVQ